jgi:large subunit ribosomal protein L2
MGKRIIQQRRGRGTFTYKSPSHRFKGTLKLRKYDDIEKNNFIKGKVIDIIHCPGHSAPLAKIKYENKEIILVAAPLNIRVNDKVFSGTNAPFGLGNILPLKNVPDGAFVYNIEAKPGDGGRFVRASGVSAKVLSRTDSDVIVELPSKKKKVFNMNCRAIVGEIAGGGRKEKPFVKAGKRFHAMRSKGKLYPKTSGVAMNAVDHPFGSGRGRHAGKPTIAPRFAPPGRNVGMLRAKKTGKGK